MIHPMRRSCTLLATLLLSLRLPAQEAPPVYDVVVYGDSSGAVTAAKIGSDVGVWTPNGTNLANISRATGNVGVGTTTPTALISAGAAVANIGGADIVIIIYAKIIR